jgi:hypothetical protein
VRLTIGLALCCHSQPDIRCPAGKIEMKSFADSSYIDRPAVALEGLLLLSLSLLPLRRCGAPG